MNVRALALVASFAILGCRQHAGAPVSGPFTDQELTQFRALEPIDAHTHVFVRDAAFEAMIARLNLHVLDIAVVDDTNNLRNDLATERTAAWDFAHANEGRVAVCTTFDPYRIGKPDFARAAIRQINEDFDHGAVAVKVWKNIGMEIKDASGKYVLVDDPAFTPIFQDIAAHNKTVLAHLAEPDAAWQAADPNSLSYRYYQANPAWSMQGKAGAPSKARILEARDHVLQQNPNLRWVGAHLGSMEEDFDQLSQHLDRYPNFAVDLAGRIKFLMTRPRKEMIAFITKYQDRLIYGTDTEIGFGEAAPAGPQTPREDEEARIWRYIATDDTLAFSDRTIQGLALPQPVVRRIYHDNAVKWYPGILAATAADPPPAQPMLVARTK